MKLLIIFFLILELVSSNEHRLLLTGFTKHETPKRPNGQTWNEFNYGGGYEYSTFKEYGKLYYSSNVTILEDSFNYKQYTLSSAPSVRYKLSENFTGSIGLAFFVMRKKETYLKHTVGDPIDYGIIPGAAPIAILSYKKFTMNLAYVPSISAGNIHSIGFAILFFGWTL